jgi:uncharacterized protein YegL
VSNDTKLVYFAIHLKIIVLMPYSFNNETIDSWNDRTMCVFVVDVSGSMSSQVGNTTPIAQLNQGLKDFHVEISADTTLSSGLEIGIVEFASDVQVRQTPALAADFTMPTLTTRGTTALVDGVREAIRMVQARKQWYKDSGLKFKRPWIILMTDGAPDAGQDIAGLASQIRADVQGKAYQFMPIGVEGADMAMLAQISAQMQPVLLQGLKFTEFFQWLSASMSMMAGVDAGTQVNFTPPTGWGTFTV